VGREWLGTSLFSLVTGLAQRPLLALVVAVLAVEVVGASGAVFTVQGLGAWYDSLQQPALAPPNWVFVVVLLTGPAGWSKMVLKTVRSRLGGQADG